MEQLRRTVDEVQKEMNITKQADQLFTTYVELTTARLDADRKAFEDGMAKREASFNEYVATQKTARDVYIADQKATMLAYSESLKAAVPVTSEQARLCKDAKETVEKYVAIRDKERETAAAEKTLEGEKPGRIIYLVKNWEKTIEEQTNAVGIETLEKFVGDVREVLYGSKY